MTLLETFLSWLPSWDSSFTLVALTAALGGVIFALDDLWIDAYALVHRLRPTFLDEPRLTELQAKPQKKIAILIANWHEADVLSAMINGNLQQIEYANYTFFLGVYPNDLETLEVAKQLEAQSPQVKVVVNSKFGPTTKGQMLNEMARAIIWSEKTSEPDSSNRYDLFLLQDSEDVLHPLSLQLINDAAEGYDFVQIPVFSFNLPLRRWIGSTYLEEFSEIHTKELLVREHMGAAIPSAGVGTALSRSLVLHNMERLSGNFLREDTLTEDYDLGLNAKANGFKSRFVSAYRKLPDCRADFIATREYFPNRLRASIRQKTRWTLGIAFQGSRHLGWRGDRVDQYFLFRDRRGPFNAVLNVFAFATLTGYVGYEVSGTPLPELLTSELFVIPAGFNLASLSLRVVQRARAVTFVNGAFHAFFVPLRWPIGSLINTAAAFNAFKTDFVARLSGIAPKWEKTAHVLPEGFGQTAVLRSPIADRTANTFAEAEG